MKITKEQIIKNQKRISRELEFEISAGWVSKHKIHKTSKDYNRKSFNKNMLLNSI